jgi:hypothetical protein
VGVDRLTTLGGYCKGNVLLKENHIGLGAELSAVQRMIRNDEGEGRRYDILWTISKLPIIVLLLFVSIATILSHLAVKA